MQAFVVHSMASEDWISIIGLLPSKRDKTLKKYIRSALILLAGGKFLSSIQKSASPDHSEQICEILCPDIHPARELCRPVIRVIPQFSYVKPNLKCIFAANWSIPMSAELRSFISLDLLTLTLSLNSKTCSLQMVRNVESTRYSPHPKSLCINRSVQICSFLYLNIQEQYSKVQRFTTQKNNSELFWAVGDKVWKIAHILIATEDDEH